MSQHVTASTGTAPEVRIVWPMNDHGAITGRVESENQVRQIVEYESADVKEALAGLPAGATIPLKMESVGMRGNAWRVVGLVDDRRARDKSSSRPEYTSEQKYAPDDERHEHQDTIQA